jgi:hypothetical protein
MMQFHVPLMAFSNPDETVLAPTSKQLLGRSLGISAMLLVSEAGHC